MLSMWVVWTTIGTLLSWFTTASTSNSPVTVDGCDESGNNNNNSTDANQLPRIVTSTVEADSLISEWQNGGPSLLVDVPLNTSYSTSILIKHAFEKQGVEVQWGATMLSKLDRAQEEEEKSDSSD